MCTDFIFCDTFFFSLVMKPLNSFAVFQWCSALRTTYRPRVECTHSTSIITSKPKLLLLFYFHTIRNTTIYLLKLKGINCYIVVSVKMPQLPLVIIYLLFFSFFFQNVTKLSLRCQTLCVSLDTFCVSKNYASTFINH